MFKRLLIEQTAILETLDNYSEFSNGPWGCLGFAHLTLLPKVSLLSKQGIAAEGCPTFMGKLGQEHPQHLFTRLSAKA